MEAKKENNTRRGAPKRGEKERVPESVALLVWIAIGGCLYIVGKEIYNWATNMKEQQWVPQTLVQYVLMQAMPSVLENPTILAKYGPVNVHDQSISFNFFNSQKDLVISFLVYQQRTGFRVGTVYFDMHRDELDNFTLTNAYLSYAGGGEPLDLGLNPKDYTYYVFDHKFSAEGTMMMVEKARAEEMARAKEMAEREARAQQSGMRELFKKQGA